MGRVSICRSESTAGSYGPGPIWACACWTRLEARPGRRCRGARKRPKTDGATDAGPLPRALGLYESGE